MTEKEPGLEPSKEDARITSLDEQLRQAQSAEDARTGRPPEGMALVRTTGAKVLSDLIGIPLGSAVIGFLVDKLAGTAPWVMLVMMFLGFGIAVRNVMRSTQQPSE